VIGLRATGVVDLSARDTAVIVDVFGQRPNANSRPSESLAAPCGPSSRPSASDGGAIMNTIVIGTAPSSALLPVAFWAAGGAVPAAGQRLRAVSYWNEALTYRLEEFVLELLAAIVLIAIVMIVTEPETREAQS